MSGSRRLLVSRSISRRAAVALVAALSMVTSVMVSASAPATAQSSPESNELPAQPVADDPLATFAALSTVETLVSISPLRFADTRPGQSTFDGLFEGAGKLAANTEYEVQMTGRGGVPLDAIGAVVNVTTVDPESFGFLTVYNCAKPRPVASSLNYVRNVDLGNEIIAGLSPTGSLCVYALRSMHLVIDVVGFLPVTSDITPIVPKRFADSRPGELTFDNLFEGFGRPAAGVTTKIGVAGRGGVPTGVDAVIANITAVAPTDIRYVQAHACLNPVPVFATVNYVPGVDRGNEILLDVDGNGDVCVTTPNSVDFVLDVVGYVVPGTNLKSIVPARLGESRLGHTTEDGLFNGFGRMAAGTTQKIRIGGRGNIPANANSAILNVTGVNADGVGSLVVHPCVSPPPEASSLNYIAGVDGGNELIAKLDSNGDVCVTVSTGIDVVIDALGYLAFVPSIPNEADLAVTKTASPDPVQAGQTITYTVKVTNAGPMPATGVTAMDVLPAGVTFVSTSGCAEGAAGVPTCTLGTIDVGASKQYTIDVTVDSGTAGTITNSVAVKSDLTDPNTANNVASVVSNANATADLSITKTDDVDPVVAGDTVTYTVTVANAGPNDATGVVVTDTLPAGLTFVSTTGCAESPAAGVPTCTLGTVANGASKAFTLQATVDAAVTGVLTNQATVGSATSDPNAANNATSEDTTAEPTADLSITKVDDVVTTVVAGDTIIYTVAVTNNGPNDAADVVVTDDLPAGITLVTTAGCTPEDTTDPVSCSLGTIANGANKQFTIEATVNAAFTGGIANTATVSTTTLDPNNTNNSATENTTADPVADVAITKVDDVTGPIHAGDTIIYSVTVTNSGPDDATNVVVADDLPAGVTLVTTAGCTPEDTTDPISCSLGTIANGANKAFTIEVTVNAGFAGSIANTATASSDTFDPIAGDNSATENTTVDPVADLAITKEDDVDPILVGNTLTYTVTVTNNGPQDAVNVVVADDLPTGVTLVTTAGCAPEDTTDPISCSLGTIANGANKVFTIETTAASAGAASNTATVTSDTFDSNGADNLASQGTTITSPPTAVNDGPPMGSTPGDDFHTPFNTTLTATDGSSEDLLANDTLGFPVATITSFGGVDVGGTVTTNAAGATANFGTDGQLTVNGDGSFVFKPDTGTTGPVSFEYRITNSGGTSDATVTIAVGVRPSATNESRDATGNVGLDTSIAPAFSVLTNDTGDGIVATAATLTSTAGAAVEIFANGQFTYDPPAGYVSPGGTPDTFTYTMGNGFTTEMATVSITVSDTIWFIDSASTATGDDGTLANPFLTLAAFNTANTGVAPAPQPGHAIFVATGTGDYTGGVDLRDTQLLIGQASSATVASLAGITLPANSRALPAVGTAPVITNTAGNGIDLAVSNTVRGLDIGNTTGTGLNGANVGTLAVSEVGVSGPGGGVDLTSPTSAAINVTLDEFTAASSTDEGIRLNNVTGALTVNGAANTINTTGVPAIDINGGTGGINLVGTFASVSSTGGLNGILLTDVADGNLAINGGTISSPSSRGADLDNVFGIMNIGSAITSSLGRSVEVTDSAGTITFSGAITDSGDGINLNTNTGGTINFSGVVDLDTTASDAFTAINGGTVNVTGVNNDIDTTSGRAIRVENTDIGANDLNFRSVSVNGATTGIVLNNTGTAGGLKVGAGGATVGDGGTIENVTNAALLTQTSNVDWRWVRVRDVSGDGVIGDRVTDGSGGAEPSFRVQDCEFLDIGTLSSDDVLDFATNKTGGSFNITGSLIVQDCVFDEDAGGAANSFEGNGLLVENHTGSLTITVDDSTFRDTPVTGDVAINVIATGTASTTLNVTDSIADQVRGEMVLLLAEDAGASADLNFMRNRVAGTNTGVSSIGAGVIVAVNKGASATFDITDNRPAACAGCGFYNLFQDPIELSINDDNTNANGSLEGRVNRNEFQDSEDASIKMLLDGDSIGAVGQRFDAKVEFRDNNIVRAGAPAAAGALSGINISIRDSNTGAPSQVDLTFRDNTFGGLGGTDGLDVDDGIHLNVFNTHAVVDVLLDNTDVLMANPGLFQSFLDNSVHVRARDSSTVNMTVINSSIDNPIGTQEFRFRTEQPGTTGCLDFRGNTDPTGNGTLRLEESAGNLNVVQTAATLLTANTGFTTVTESGTAPNYGAVGPCAQPTAPANS